MSGFNAFAQAGFGWRSLRGKSGAGSPKVESLARRATGPRRARTTTRPHLGRKNSRNGTPSRSEHAKTRSGPKHCWSGGSPLCSGRELVSSDETQSRSGDALLQKVSLPSDPASVPSGLVNFPITSVRPPSAGETFPSASIHFPMASVCLPIEPERRNRKRVALRRGLWA